jgi:hypothetical protein
MIPGSEPGWTDIDVATQSAWCRLRSIEDGYAVYRKSLRLNGKLLRSTGALTRYKMDGATLLVHLIEQTNVATKGQVVKCGLKHYGGAQTCECPGNGAERHASHAADAGLARHMGQLSIDAAAATHAQQAGYAAQGYAAYAYAPQAGYTISPPAAPQQMAGAAAPEAYAHGYAAQPCYAALPQPGYVAPPPAGPPEGPPAAAPAGGQYTTNAHGLAVNTAGGTVELEQRSIHLGNLSRKTRMKDVRQLIARKVAARVVAIDLHTDATDRCKGSAVVHFATADQANYAVGMLNDAEWIGKRIRVKLAKEASAVRENVQGPVIVNGTTAF